MTREIKFRAWDKELKQWLQFPLWFEDGKVFHFDGKEYKELNQSRIEIMQYTDLKDKNGKEIYEGDIVKCNFAWGDNICEIVEEKGCYWVSQRNREIENQAHDNLYWHNEGCEIIGNIYESKHLLDNTDTKTQNY